MTAPATTHTGTKGARVTQPVHHSTGTRNYPTEQQAFRRVEQLRRQGIWPAVIKIGTGQWYRIMHDPDDADGDQ